MRILFLAPYPANESPSQRYRFEHYFSFLTSNRIEYDYKSFLDMSTWKVIFKQGHYFKKVTGILYGFIQRFFQLFILYKYNYIYIHREASPAGPPVFEWIISKILRKKIIYDFDDAIWIPATSIYNKAASSFKNFGKVAKICKWSYKISVGNSYLAQFALQYNKNVFIIPTVVNTETVHNKLQDQQTTRPAVGWTGSFSTLKYLDIVTETIKELQAKFDFKFIVIADKDPQLPLDNYVFIKWNKNSETNDLLNFHIGIMPLYDDEISKGKCGFKAIQYMSLGIPAIVSPVGVNTEIVTDGFDGFVCASKPGWSSKIEKLLVDSALRQQMGMAARKKVENNYSVKATSQMFLDLFN